MTPLEQAQNDAIAQMRDVLQDGFLELQIARYTLEEDLAAGVCRVQCQVCLNGADPVAVEGEGVGTIDALFNGLKRRFASEYPSLESIRFTGLFVKGLMTDSKQQHGADAAAEARVEVANSTGRSFTFTATSGSVSRSSIEAVLAAVQYFVNSERTYVTLYLALQHYRSEGRADLVEKYTGLLAEMVRNTSYSAAVERLATNPTR